MTKKRGRRSDDPVLRYLRKIEAKLDRINKGLDKFLSAPKAKRKRAALGIPKRLKVFGTEKAAEKYQKKHPDDAEIIITGVPRAKRDNE